MHFPPEEECPDFDEPGEPSTHALRELLRLIPTTVVQNGELDLTRLTDEERAQLQRSAADLHQTALHALTAIGELLEHVMRRRHIPDEIYGWRLGLLLKLIAELMAMCREVERENTE